VVLRVSTAVVCHLSMGPDVKSPDPLYRSQTNVLSSRWRDSLSDTGKITMSEACTLIATAVPNPENMGEMKNYLQNSGRLLGALGGGTGTRMKVHEVVNGYAAAIVLVMDFPSRKALSDFFASDEYQALIPGRDRGFKSINIWIAGPM
jgi:uncharacterized protein (DUF1330 family)